jgi:hypothetical protein
MKRLLLCALFLLPSGCTLNFGIADPKSRTIYEVACVVTEEGLAYTVTTLQIRYRVQLY